MKHTIIVFLLVLSFLVGCSSNHIATEPIYDPPITADVTITTEVSDATITSELSDSEITRTQIAQIEDLLEILAPITDYSLLGKAVDFYNIAIPASLYSQAENVIDQLSAIADEIALMVDPILIAEIPDGYGLKDNWSSLSDSCLSLKNNISKAMDALIDNDPTLVMELRENIGNTSIVEKAIAIQNVLSKELAILQEKANKLNIEVLIDYDACKAKAAKYVRYRFENEQITEDDLSSDKTPIVFNDVPGKHYVFTLIGHDEILILINVEDCSIICREITPNGYRDIYGILLPAESDDVAMPDVIGMDFKEAKALLDSMGIKYTCDSAIDTDSVPEGAVAYTYPSAGTTISADSVVNIMKEIDVEAQESDNGDSIGKAETTSPIAGNIVEIRFAPDDYYLHPEHYAVYNFEGLEYGNDAILLPNAEIYDFKFFLLDSEKLFMDDEYIITEILYTNEVISPSRPFVTRIYIAGPGGPYYGVSFLDAFGNQYSYVIYESGIDGSFTLVPF